MAFEIAMRIAGNHSKSCPQDKIALQGVFGWQRQMRALLKLSMMTKFMMNIYLKKIYQFFALFVACSSINSFSCHHWSSNYPLDYCYFFQYRRYIVLENCPPYTWARKILMCFLHSCVPWCWCLSACGFRTIWIRGTRVRM
jgi:hypothetical protein